MATEIEARLKISAFDKTGKAFQSVEARLRKAERMAALANRQHAALAKAERGLNAHSGALIGVGSGRLLAGVGGLVAGGAIAGAIRDYAALERQMTRIGLAAGATDDEAKVATRSVADLADQFALPLDQAVTGLDALVATGMDMKQAMAFLPSILRTSQASGAATDEMAASANSLATSFKVAGSEMQQAFDMLVTGGQLGQFELKDMAAYLPSLTASAAKLGFNGLDGTKKLVAMLQTVRQVSGTSAEAATAVGDAIEKTLSPTVQKAFAKRGIDIGRVLEGAAKKGKNQFEAVIDVLDDMTRGMSDTQRNMAISSIYTDKEARRAVTAMIALRDAYRQYEAQIANSAGATENNLQRVLADSQASVDRLANSWGNLWKAIGRGADAAGASGVMEDLAGGIHALIDLAEKPEARAAFANDYAKDAARQEQETKKRDIFAAERRRDEAMRSRSSLSANAVDLGFAAAEDRDISKQRAAVEAALLARAEAEARALWGSSDRGFTEGLPAWMNTDWVPPQPAPAEWVKPKRGEMPLPPRDPRQASLPVPGSIIGTPAWPVGNPMMPAPSSSRANPAPTNGTGGLSFAEPLIGRAEVDTLRQAMESGGGTLKDAGVDAGAAFYDGAARGAALLNQAADRLERSLENGAAAISAAKPQMPSAPAAGRGVYPLGNGAPNANLGTSMPNAGTPGG